YLGFFISSRRRHTIFSRVWSSDVCSSDLTRNFATSMAKAGNITIAEVEQLVQPGEIDPDHVHVAGIYVHRIFQGSNYEKRIERKIGRASCRERVRRSASRSGRAYATQHSR